MPVNALNRRRRVFESVTVHCTLFKGLTRESEERLAACLCLRQRFEPLGKSMPRILLRREPLGLSKSASFQIEFMDFWEKKLAAFLPDPPPKPLSIQEHREVAESLLLN